MAGFFAVLACDLAAAAEAERPLSFQNDVMAVLSKAGCNAGVCHGNLNGKGGFKLSLRGQDPATDYETLVRGLLGRRIDTIEPDVSLLLRKPTTAVSHEGGQRFSADSPEYRILREWIASGAPSDVGSAPRLVRLRVSPREQIVTEPGAQVRITAEAEFSDGSTRDVTRMAVYQAVESTTTVDIDGNVAVQPPAETTVLVRYLDQQEPVRLAFVAGKPEELWQGPEPANFIDEHVFARLRALRLQPSALTTDEVFLRRVYLDLLGILPTADEARAFAAEESPDKRARVIDELLVRPEFASHWAMKWSDLLHNEEKTLDRKGVQVFHHWIRQAIDDGMPLDEFTRQIVTARGSTYRVPASNFYRALRDPVSRAESVAQAFLGVRLQCAKCHNHPFDRWTQDDYYRWSAVFAQVEYKVLANRRRDENDKHEFDGEQIVWIASGVEMRDPRTGKAAPPRMLDSGSTVLTTGGSVEPDTGGSTQLTAGDRLEELADWIADPQNPFFAAAQANRIWYHLMGRGIVEPIDDFRATNPASNPPLLEALRAELVSSNFDLRSLLRAICNSRTYQLSSEPNDANRDDERNFSHALVRRLPAEQLLDAVYQVSDTEPNFNGYPEGVRAGDLPGVQAVRPRDQRPSPDDAFLSAFGKPARLLSCECERPEATTLAQAFNLVSGEVVHKALAAPENRLGQMLVRGSSSEQMVDELFWTALSRPPTEDELAAAVGYISQAEDRRAAIEDIAWGLINAKEFLLRH